MSYAGHDMTLKVPGSALTLTAEATTEVSGTVFQITDAAKRVLDHSAAIVIKSGATTITSGYTLNRLTGTITFGSSRTGETITVSGDYLPLVAVGDASSFKVSIKRNNGDESVLGTGWVKRGGLMMDVSGSITRFDDNDQYYGTLITDDVPIVVEVSLGGTQHCLIWGIVSTEGVDGAADSFIEGGIEFESNADLDGNAIAFV